LLKTDIYNIAQVIGPAVTGLNATSVSQTLSASGSIHEFWDNTSTRKAYVDVNGDWYGRDLNPSRQVIAGTYIGSTTGTHTWACHSVFFLTNADFKCEYDGTYMFRWDNAGNYIGVASIKPGTGLVNSSYTFTSLPVCNSGSKFTQLGISDSNTAVFNDTITASGANIGIAFCDGTNWKFH
jgi:hypothetical protein